MNWFVFWIFPFLKSCNFYLLPSPWDSLIWGFVLEQMVLVIGMQKTSKGFAAQPFGRSNFKGSTFSHVWRGWKASGWLARGHTWRWKKTLCNRSSNERRTPRENEEIAESVNPSRKYTIYCHVSMGLIMCPLKSTL